MAQMLALDQSPFALRPAGGMAAVIEMVDSVSHAAANARPLSTRAKDAYAMRKFAEFCMTLDTPCWRTAAWRTGGDVYKRESMIS